MSVDFFAKLPRNDAPRRDEAVMEYIHTAYQQMCVSNVPTLDVLLTRWRNLAAMCVTGGLWRINWPERDRQISVSATSVSFPLVANICDSDEEADHFVAVSIEMQVWLPSKPTGVSYPWVHRYVRDALAYQWVVEQIENDRVNTSTYGVLGNLRNRPEVIVYLSAAVQDPKIFDRRHVIEAAVKRMGRKVVPLLLQLISACDMNSISDIHAKNAAILAIGQFPSHETAMTLLAQLNIESSEWTRHILVEALGKMEDKGAIEPLAAMLQNPNETVGVRDQAAIALAKIGDKSAIEPLAAVLQNPNETVRVRSQAAVSLAKIDPNARDKLQLYLNEPALADYYQFELALEILDEPEPGKLLSINKASKYFNISRATINRWQQKGLIKPVYTPGGQRRFKEVELNALIGGEEHTSSNRGDRVQN